MDLDVQIQLDLDFQAGISCLLAVFACLGVRGAALAQCVPWVAVKWVATSWQWFLCDIGCILGTAIFSNQYLPIPKALDGEQVLTYTLSAIFLFLFLFFFGILIGGS